jgi:restriction system protein
MNLWLHNQRWKYRSEDGVCVTDTGDRLPAALFAEQASLEAANRWAQLGSLLRTSVERSPVPERFRFAKSRPPRPALRPVPPLAPPGSMSRLHEAQARAAAKSVQEENARKLAEYEAAVTAFEAERERIRDKALAFEAVRSLYPDGDLERYFAVVLDVGDYPSKLPTRRFLHFAPDAERLVLDFQLPVPDELPRLKKLAFVARSQEFRTTEHPESAVRGLYDSYVNQTALWAVDLIFRSDPQRRIGAIVFNGFIDTRNPATGGPLQGCILSVQVTRAEFANLDLQLVDPKQCVRKLKGVAAASLYELTPIPPLAQAPDADVRFIEGRAVLSAISEGSNLAAMPWDDFEHLIREVFEREFSTTGADVKVTRGSRDGGVDAVIVDPDPIRGGKIIVQAKRYTHTVDVSAVRDLYGTVLNEGAGSGILVTTSDFGPDSYQFAKDKPLKLLNGGNLLFLLEKHGRKAHIDVAAARKILGLTQATSK